MPASQTKRTTSEPALSQTEPPAPLLPDQQEFHQHLRALAQSAVRTVSELVMCEELDAFIGAAWGESSPKRKGYRNGTYTRALVTSAGRLEQVNVPRDRAGQFHTQVFDRYSRYEPHLADGLTEMFVAGVSTHKVGEVAQTLMGVAPSASTISRLNQSLAQQFEEWRVLYLDGVHFSIRHGDQADSTLILTALGVDLAGNKEVLAALACAEEDKDGWAWRLARSAQTRRHPHRVSSSPMGMMGGFRQLQTCLGRPLGNAVWSISNATSSMRSRDENEGLCRPNSLAFGSNPVNRRPWFNWPRALAKYSQRYPEAVRSLAEEEEKTLTFYAFPQSMHRHIQTTNAIESLAEQYPPAHRSD